MTRTARVLAIICLCCAIPAIAAAQQEIRPDEWGQGTTLNGFVGIGADSSQRGPVVGGAVGWELTPRFAIEGSGGWTEFGHGTTAFAGALKLRARLFGHRKLDPFVQAGAGLYRTTFGERETAVPDFYRRRIAAQLPGNVGRTFTDPTIVGGGGVNVFINRRVAIRPDVEAAVAIYHRRAHVVTTVGLHIVYHFEDHPVTPLKRP